MWKFPTFFTRRTIFFELLAQRSEGRTRQRGYCATEAVQNIPLEKLPDILRQVFGRCDRSILVANTAACVRRSIPSLASSRET